MPRCARVRLAVLVLAAVALILPAWALYLAVVLPAGARGAELGRRLGRARPRARRAGRRRAPRPASPLALDPVLGGALAAALVCDAWFDVMTSTGDDRLFAVGLAVLVELPIAAVAAVVGVRSTSRRGF